MLEFETQGEEVGGQGQEFGVDGGVSQEVGPGGARGRGGQGGSGAVAIAGGRRESRQAGQESGGSVAVGRVSGEGGALHKIAQILHTHRGGFSGPGCATHESHGNDASLAGALWSQHGGLVTTGEQLGSAPQVGEAQHGFRRLVSQSLAGPSLLADKDGREISQGCSFLAFLQKEAPAVAQDASVLDSAVMFEGELEGGGEVRQDGCRVTVLGIKTGGVRKEQSLEVSEVGLVFQSIVGTGRNVPLDQAAQELLSSGDGARRLAQLAGPSHDGSVLGWGQRTGRSGIQTGHRNQSLAQPRYPRERIVHSQETRGRAENQLGVTRGEAAQGLDQLGHPRRAAARQGIEVREREQGRHMVRVTVSRHQSEQLRLQVRKGFGGQTLDETSRVGAAGEGRQVVVAEIGQRSPAQVGVVHGEPREESVEHLLRDGLGRFQSPGHLAHIGQEGEAQFIRGPRGVEHRNGQSKVAEMADDRQETGRGHAHALELLFSGKDSEDDCAHRRQGLLQIEAKVAGAFAQGPKGLQRSDQDIPVGENAGGSQAFELRGQNTRGVLQ
ncbi:MAG: hypothetical protein ABGY71_05580 [bacterium]|nr:hypothetical protein [Planctomycetota bacterium]HIL51199.1 hypothetical protein [Planctomycetota bacterium]